MKQSVLLILVDGMRPDAIAACGNSYAAEFAKSCFVKYDAKTVWPSVTLPCHFSLFTSVTPQRHGVLTNTYVSMVRPVSTLTERLAGFGKRCAMFYNWEELRDLSRPGTLHRSSFVQEDTLHISDAVLAEDCIAYIRDNAPDFTFLYLGGTDGAGHDHGWMSAEYLQTVDRAWSLIEKTVKSLPEGYTVIVTADHGGHGQNHGDDIPEDMTIPLYIRPFGERKLSPVFSTATIMDIAPTVSILLGVPADRNWKGRNLLRL